MGQPVINLHNHTPFSDGALTIDELCEAHLALPKIKVTGVGICDTLFATPTSRPATNDRQFQQLFRNEAREYVEMVLQARKNWAGKLDIYCGCEIHWSFNKANLDAIRGILNELEIQYVVFSGLDWAGLTQLANQARRFPCPVGLTRTDVGERFPNTSMDQVVRTMANARIFWELSPELLQSPTTAGWGATLAQHRVRIAVGSDTHDDERCLKSIGAMYEFVDAKGLGEKLFVPQPRQAAAQMPAAASA